LPRPDRCLHTSVDWLHSGWPIAKSPYYLDMTTSIAWKSSERIWIASIWLGIALFQATQTVIVMRAEGMHHSWLSLFTTLLLSWLPWTLATPLAVHLGRQFPLLSGRSAFTWLTHFSVCMGINVLAAAWTAGLEELLNPWAKSLNPEPFAPLWLDKAYNGLLQSVFLYSGILAVSYFLQSRARLVHQQTETARLAEQLAKAQLESLRRQIEPHFLFNSLNAIAGLVREGRNDLAVTAVVSLSEFLRKTIQHHDRQEISLGEEVEYLEKYLEIQKLRFAERIQISLDVPQDLFSLQVPSLILQPLVENAVKHGIAKQARGGWIRVAAFCSNDSLTLRVYNDGPNLPQDWDTTESGVGIVNVRARLKNLYGDRFKFVLHNQNSGVEALLSVPLRQG
jgi:two-component system, LytTR family, sensor kinase